MRLVGQRLAERTGQQVVIENRPSAGGIIAAAAVTSAQPDGYTLFVLSSGIALSKSLLKTMPFDPVCLFMLAQIHSSRGQHAETLDVLERAIALQRRGPLFRVRLYAESLLALAKDEKARRIAEPARRLRNEFEQPAVFHESSGPD